jgi:acyl carrier protein
MNKEYNDIEKSVKKILSNLLGIEPDDIENDFSLTEDLHMKPDDLTDFLEILSKMDFNTEQIDFTEIETFSDLIDYLIQHQ